MTMQSTIETKIVNALSPAHLEVLNESHMHNVPPGSESHFKLIIVTDEFSGLSRVGRHQKINGILKNELDGGIHALSMQTMTPEEWAAKGGAIMQSPECHGGSKADR
jgi:BolA protein